MRPVSELHRSDLFGYLPIDDIDKLTHFSRVRELGAHEWILHRDSPAEHLYLVLEGRVELRLPAHKGESAVLLHTLASGTFVGVSALIGGETYTASALTAAPTNVLEIDGKPLRHLIATTPKLGTEIVSLVARGYAERYRQVLTRLQAVVNQLPMLCIAVHGPRSSCG
jgi:CRP/FNR family transcriptional regulator, cyclic AMP receptor protein